MNFIIQLIGKIRLIISTIISYITYIIRQIIAKVTLAGFIAIILLAIFFFWEAIVTQVKHTVACHLINQGDNAYKNEKYVKAIKRYEHALVLYPEHFQARYNLGNIYVAYEDYEAAAKNYEAALKVKPNFLKARINLGIILTEELGEIDKAINHYIRAVRTKPFMMGFIYNNKAEVKADKSIAYYNLGLAYKSKSLLLSNNKLAASKALQNAAESYLFSLKLDPKSYDTHYNLALTYQLLGDYLNAKKYYCKAINMKPLNYESHYNFGILLKQKGKFFDSIEELEKAGLILDSKGDSYRTRYIYEILNEVNQRAVLKEGFKNFVKMSEKKVVYKPYEIKYINGKVVISDRLDSTIWNNLKTCGACKGE